MSAELFVCSVCRLPVWMLCVNRFGTLALGKKNTYISQREETSRLWPVGFYTKNTEKLKYVIEPLSASCFIVLLFNISASQMEKNNETPSPIVNFPGWDGQSRSYLADDIGLSIHVFPSPALCSHSGRGGAGACPFSLDKWPVYLAARRQH